VNLKHLPIEYDGFEKLVDFFRKEAGLTFSETAAPTLDRKLRARMTVLGFRSFRQYATYLTSTPRPQHEIDSSLDLVTNHETYFFREEYQLRLFREDVLPQIKEMAESRHRLVLWSAGCSTGEEVYTMAMLAVESGLFDDWKVRVFGSDLSRRCIAAARQGHYAATTLRQVPPKFRQTFFIDDADGALVASTIRNRCVFARRNLLDRSRSPILGNVDAIFCRNVLIYLDVEAQHRLIDMFFHCLNPGGYLLLGHSESLLYVPNQFEIVRMHEDLVYRRPKKQVECV